MPLANRGRSPELIRQMLRETRVGKAASEVKPVKQMTMHEYTPILAKTASDPLQLGSRTIAESRPNRPLDFKMKQPDMDQARPYSPATVPT